MATIPLNLPTDINVCAVDFDIVEFRRALVQHGTQFDWDWVVSCPCQQGQYGPSGFIKTGEAIISCECRGSGNLFVERHETIGMLTDATLEARYANLFARYAAGSVLITLLPEHLPSLGDRLTLKHGVCIYEEVFTHTATTERPRFPIVTRPLWVGVEGSPGQTELRRYSVLYCRAADQYGRLTDTVYKEGTHFTVEAGSIVWTDGPPLGTRVGIRYYGRPHYIVRGFPHVHRDQYANDVAEVEDRFLMQAPVRVICEPEFLGARNPPNTAATTNEHAAVQDPNELP